jgi:hypothetical protein
MLSRQMQREEECLDRDLKNGVINIKEYNQSMRDLEADYRDAARDAASKAYDCEMERW